jgi:uncharacterized protein YyaL (SSP411 family)
MASGGIRDPVGGGFHRYSTDPRWEVPHFEKMLYDNAQIAALYLEAGAALGERRYVDVATDTLDFLLREMEGANGGFYASLDADSGGREGAFYVWSARELCRVLGDSDGAVVARILGVSDTGRFEGASAANRRAPFADVAAATGGTAAAVSALWVRARPALLAARASRPRPRTDTKIVTAWNGLAIEALAAGFEATGDARYRDAAMRAADFLWRVHRSSTGGLFRSSNAGVPIAAAVLQDYAAFAAGLVALFQVTNDPEMLDRALALVHDANARFRAPGGGWYEAEADATPFPRALSLDDSVEPSGSATLLHDELALFALTLRPELAQSTEEALGFRADAVRARGMGAAGWLDAALLRSGPFYDVLVAADGSAGAPLEAAWRALDPGWTVFARVPAGGPTGAFAQIVAASAAKTSGAKAARAFVCSQGACQAPTEDPVAVRAQILQGWKL